MRKSNLSSRERKLLQGKRRRVKHGEGVWIKKPTLTLKYLINSLLKKKKK